MKNGELSTTKTTETGAFIRVTVRKGKKRKQKTKRFTKNERKVIFGHIGDFEVYTYPYDYPDTVFVGKFPVSTMIEKGQETSLIRLYNIIRAYFEGHYYSEDGREKAANVRRHTVQRAHNSGLDRVKKHK